jgi:UPF0755 protein
MKKTGVVFALILIISIAVSIWWYIGKSPVNPQSKQQKTFVVSQQENIRDIATNLKKAELIRSPIIFFLTVKLLQLDGKIQAGDFQLSPSQTTQSIAESLTHGTTDIWVIIPEGKRASEIAEIIQSKIPSYQESWKDILATEEGYLFPDTYLFSKDTTITTIIYTMKNNFNKKYQQAAENQTAKLSQADAVILASIVEREGKSEEEMKTIASVLENRLAIHMALQTDSTIQYALGYQTETHSWWKTPTPADLKIQSPYNTYLYPGLPPTPIANPGLVALKSVLNPVTTSYFYYYTDPSGKTHFAKTIQEHNANIQKYSQ